MNPIVRKNMPKFVIQLSFRAVEKTHAKWQALVKLGNNRQMYDSQASGLTAVNFSYFLFIQMSAISPAFGPDL